MQSAEEFVFVMADATCAAVAGEWRKDRDAPAATEIRAELSTAIVPST